jgi:hypothetical protein
VLLHIHVHTFLNAKEALVESERMAPREARVEATSAVAKEETAEREKAGRATAVMDINIAEARETGERTARRLAHRPPRPSRRPHQLLI